MKFTLVNCTRTTKFCSLVLLLFGATSFASNKSVEVKFSYNTPSGQNYSGQSTTPLEKGLTDNMVGKKKYDDFCGKNRRSCENSGAHSLKSNRFSSNRLS